MLVNFRWAFGLAAACSVTMGLGIASCSDEPPAEEVSATPVPLEPKGEVAGAVTPPAGLRKVDVPACARGADGCPNDYPQPFFIEDIGQTDINLYVAFKYRGRGPIGGAAPAAEVSTKVLTLDGCTVGRPTARGAVRQTGDGTSWIEIPMGALPAGEFELRLQGRVGTSSIFNSIWLVKSGTSVAHLLERQRQGYREVAEVDPRTGFTRTVSLVDESEAECAP